MQGPTELNILIKILKSLYLDGSIGPYMKEQLLSK